MTGILEQISSQLTTVSQQLAQVLAAPAAVAYPMADVQPPAQFVPPAQQQPIPLQPPLGQYPPATQEMIVALVTPLVNDPNCKGLLQQQMHAMGIQALPDAQPHQYPELYARFQQVAAQFNQQPQAQQPAAAPASII